MKIKYLVKGVIKSIPGIEHIYKFHTETGGTNSARYCYSVWMRHLIHAYDNGMSTMPEKIAELGPGDSLGIGLSALISGSEQYLALDIVKYSNAEFNLKIFDELVVLFKNREAIPGDAEFPNMKPAIKSHSFPDYIFTEAHLKKVLDENRLLRIRNSIKALEATESNSSAGMITYIAPWNETIENNIEPVDMIISQAVLQHIDGLATTYRLMYKWLKPSGVMSHTIDFKCMGSSDKWYGHWAYSDSEWKIVRGRKKYLINREPYSTHIGLLKNNNFDIISEKRTISEDVIDRKKLANRFKQMSVEDSSISGVFIQATRKMLTLFGIISTEMPEYLLLIGV